MSRILILVAMLLSAVLPVSANGAPAKCLQEAKLALRAKYSIGFGEDAVVDGPYTPKAVELREQALRRKCIGCNRVGPVGLGPDWDRLKQQIRPGDCLIGYTSDTRSWQQLMGISGYALIRDRAVIQDLHTIIN